MEEKRKLLIQGKNGAVIKTVPKTKWIPFLKRYGESRRIMYRCPFCSGVTRKQTQFCPTCGKEVWSEHGEDK